MHNSPRWSALLVLVICFIPSCSAQVAATFSITTEEACTTPEVWALEGEELSLCCILPDPPAHYKHYWLKIHSGVISENEQTFPQHLYTAEKRKSNEWWITIKGLHRTDEGHYQCYTSTRTGQDKFYRIITVHVSVPPQIGLQSQPLVQGYVGDDVTLSCYASGVPQPVVSWYRADESGNMESLNLTGSHINLKHISESTRGRYQCVADNGFGEAQTRLFYVSTFYPPTVMVMSKTLMFSAGHAVSVSCIVDSNPPATAVRWQRDDGQLIKHGRDNYTISSRQPREGLLYSWLRFTLTSQKAGTYHCLAQNKVGNSSDTAVVIEKSDLQPWVTSPPRPVVVKPLGIPSYWSCKVENMGPNDWMSWWWLSPKYGKQLLYTTSDNLQPNYEDAAYTPAFEIVSGTDLRIWSVQFEDSGKFICQVSDKLNYTSTLSVVGPVECGNNGPIFELGEQTNMSCKARHQGEVNTFEFKFEHINKDRIFDPSEVINGDRPNVLYRKISLRMTTNTEGYFRCKLTTPLASDNFQDECFMHIMLKTGQQPGWFRPVPYRAMKAIRKKGEEEEEEGSGEMSDAETFDDAGYYDEPATTAGHKQVTYTTAGVLSGVGGILLILVLVLTIMYIAKKRANKRGTAHLNLSNSNSNKIKSTDTVAAATT